MWAAKVIQFGFVAAINVWWGLQMAIFLDFFYFGRARFFCLRCKKAVVLYAVALWLLR
jgi:hypothetical protein